MNGECSWFVSASGLRWISCTGSVAFYVECTNVILKWWRSHGVGYVLTLLLTWTPWLGSADSPGAMRVFMPDFERKGGGRLSKTCIRLCHYLPPGRRALIDWDRNHPPPCHTPLVCLFESRFFIENYIYIYIYTCIHKNSRKSRGGKGKEDTKKRGRGMGLGD